MNKDKLDVINELLEIQGSHGNWNYDEYSMGLYNGMELLVAILEDRDPVFKTPPKLWLVDIPETPLRVIEGGLRGSEEVLCDDNEMAKKTSSH